MKDETKTKNKYEKKKIIITSTSHCLQLFYFQVFASINNNTYAELTVTLIKNKIKHNWSPRQLQIRKQ